LFIENSELSGYKRASPYCAGQVVIINGRVVGPHKVLEHHCVVIEDAVKQIAPDRAGTLAKTRGSIIEAHDGLCPVSSILHIHGALRAR